MIIRDTRVFNVFVIQRFNFQNESQSCKRNVISVDTPWKTICSEKSSMAGLILSDAVIKTFVGDIVNEIFRLPYSITIESVKKFLQNAKIQEIEKNELDFHYL